MMDPITLITGASLVSIGMVIGRAMRAKPPKPERPICTCNHGYGQHEQNGRCAAQSERTIYGVGYAVRGTEWVSCSCISYDGPEPLPKVWTP